MTSNEDESAANGGALAAVRGAVSQTSIGLFCSAVALGAGVATLVGTEALLVPGIGAVSGDLLGVALLGVAAVTYQRFGCGGSGDCGCTDDCGDRCARDP